MGKSYGVHFKFHTLTANPWPQLNTALRGLRGTGRVNKPHGRCKFPCLSCAPGLFFSASPLAFALWYLHSPFLQRGDFLLLSYGLVSSWRRPSGHLVAFGIILPFGEQKDLKGLSWSSESSLEGPLPGPAFEGCGFSFY